MTDLEKIKKEYGEQMAHFCRDNFPPIIEKGLMYEILSSHFALNKFTFIIAFELGSILNIFF